MIQSNHRILLTGTSGFIGGALLQNFSARGVEVTSLGREPAPALLGVRSVTVDLGAPGSLRAALDRLKSEAPFDAIVHLAVSRHHRDFPGKALDLFQVNAASAAELLDFARVTGVSRAVFGSTGTVYSSTTISTDAAAGNVESEFRKPNSYFAASKLFADVLCEFYRDYLPIATLRLYAPYGPGLKDRMLTDLAARVRTGQPLSLPATGPGLAFSATYVDDCLAVIDQALAGSWNETVNVASSEVWTIESAGYLLGELLGRAPQFERGQVAFAPRIVPDTSRLQQLSTHAFVGLKDGLVRMLAAGAQGS